MTAKAAKCRLRYRLLKTFSGNNLNQWNSVPHFDHLSQNHRPCSHEDKGSRLGSLNAPWQECVLSSIWRHPTKKEKKNGLCLPAETFMYVLDTFNMFLTLIECKTVVIFCCWNSYNALYPCHAYFPLLVISFKNPQGYWPRIYWFWKCLHFVFLKQTVASCANA